MTPDTFLSAISQSFQIKEGVARFVIPNQMPAGYDISQLSVHVSGTMPMVDDGSNLSLHAYESEDEVRSWQLGNEYIERMPDQWTDDTIVNPKWSVVSLASQNILCKRNFLTDNQHTQTLALSAKQVNPLPMLAVLP